MFTFDSHNHVKKYNLCPVIERYIDSFMGFICRQYSEYPTRGDNPTAPDVLAAPLLGHGHPKQPPGRK